jgi:hypothetical protein
MSEEDRLITVTALMLALLFPLLLITARAALSNEILRKRVFDCRKQRLH